VFLFFCSTTFYYDHCFPDAVMANAEKSKHHAHKRINVRRTTSRKKLEKRLKQRASVSLRVMTRLSHKKSFLANTHLNQDVFEDSLLLDEEEKPAGTLKGWGENLDEDDGEDLFPDGEDL
jgi:hypothetical protein